jgi:hypothetical protein
MPLDSINQKRLSAGQGYVELGMFAEANDQIEDIDPCCRIGAWPHTGPMARPSGEHDQPACASELVGMGIEVAWTRLPSRPVSGAANRDGRNFSSSEPVSRYWPETSSPHCANTVSFATLWSS